MVITLPKTKRAEEDMPMAGRTREGGKKKTYPDKPWTFCNSVPTYVPFGTFSITAKNSPSATHGSSSRAACKGASFPGLSPIYIVYPAVLSKVILQLR